MRMKGSRRMRSFLGRLGGGYEEDDGGCHDV